MRLYPFVRCSGPAHIVERSEQSRTTAGATVSIRRYALHRSHSCVTLKVVPLPDRRRATGKEHGMALIHIDTFITLDGVAQAPGGPEEDSKGGFVFGG